jgi:hypothetical protein
MLLQPNVGVEAVQVEDHFLNALQKLSLTGKAFS